MLCSHNGLRSVKKHVLIVFRRFHFFQGTSWPLWSHDETLEKLSAICTAGRQSHGNKLRGQKCPRPCASDSRTENNNPRRVPAEFVELNFLGGLHESLQVFNVTKTFERSFLALLTS